MVNETRLPIWAAAQSIHACGRVLFPDRIASCLTPQLLSKDEISLGNSLVFSDPQFRNLLKSGLGMPKIGGLLLSPYRSFCIFSCLWKIGKLYKSKKSHTFAPLILRGSLEAICTYMNFHQEASRIFGTEKDSVLSINISETYTKYLIRYQSSSGWSVKYVEESLNSSASLTFKDPAIARKAALGKLDSWLALTTGEILLAGRIPMLDKFGYVARIAQREVPLPK
ncbi:MAG: hypothetical protein VW907_04345 [Opitutae bacterium]